MMQSTQKMDVIADGYTETVPYIVMVVTVIFVMIIGMVEKLMVEITVNIASKA